nr:hemagglutinin repeat-containing protein [Paraburkholderia sp. C35]
MRIQIVSGNGSVTLDANQDVTVAGSELSAVKDLTLIGKNVNVAPGADAIQTRSRRSSSRFGVSLNPSIGRCSGQCDGDSQPKHEQRELCGRSASGGTRHGTGRCCSL